MNPLSSCLHAEYTRTAGAAKEAPTAVCATEGWAEFFSVVSFFHICSMHPYLLFAMLCTSNCGVTVFSTHAKTYASVSCLKFISQLQFIILKKNHYGRWHKLAL